MTDDSKASSSPWHRMRFRVFHDDPRPVIFPPPGPYWISGWSAKGDREYAILIAFIPDGDDILKYWPDADLKWDGCSDQPYNEVTFYDRFPKPDWWSPKA